MEKRQLLFVTHCTENMTEGVSYAIELAKAMDEDVMILFVQKPPELNGKFEDLMNAVTFAEAGEHRIANDIMLEGPRCGDEGARQDPGAVFDQFSHDGVRLSVHTSQFGVLSGIRRFVKEQWGIDRVILSPAVTREGDISAKDMKRLVRSISRPVVTMARQSLAVAAAAENA